LQNRIGIGYVYSSQHCSDEDARAEFDKHVVNPLYDSKLIEWNSLFLQNPWSDNVVAIGSSAGFIDPLDATALYNLQAGIVNLVRCLKKTPVVYNRLMRKIFKDSAIWIECQYGLSKRQDSSFWKTMSDRETYTPLMWANHDLRINPKTTCKPATHHNSPLHPKLQKQALAAGYHLQKSSLLYSWFLASRPHHLPD
jgi:tryptophan halogenase